MLGEVKGKVKRAGWKRLKEGEEAGREEGVAGVDISKVPFGFVVAVAAAVSGPENIAIVH